MTTTNSIDRRTVLKAFGAGAAAITTSASRVAATTETIATVNYGGNLDVYLYPKVSSYEDDARHAGNRMDETGMLRKATDSWSYNDCSAALDGYAIHLRDDGYSYSKDWNDLSDFKAFLKEKGLTDNGVHIGFADFDNLDGDGASVGGNPYTDWVHSGVIMRNMESQDDTDQTAFHELGHQLVTTDDSCSASVMDTSMNYPAHSLGVVRDDGSRTPMVFGSLGANENSTRGVCSKDNSHNSTYSFETTNCTAFAIAASESYFLS